MWPEDARLPVVGRHRHVAKVIISGSSARTPGRRPQEQLLLPGGQSHPVQHRSRHVAVRCRQAASAATASAAAAAARPLRRRRGLQLAWKVRGGQVRVQARMDGAVVLDCGPGAVGPEPWLPQSGRASTLPVLLLDCDSVPPSSRVWKRTGLPNLLHFQIGLPQRMSRIT